MADPPSAQANAYETLRAHDEDNPELFTKVSGMLDSLAGDDSPADEAPEAETTPESPADTEVVDDADTETVEGDSDDADDAEAAAPDEGAPTLPAAIRRSLTAYQWSDDEIDEAFNRDPEGFLATASKIHATRVQETQQWAALGRKSREAESEGSDPAPAPEAASPPAQLAEGSLQQIDFAKMAEESGFDEGTLRQAFGPVANTIDAINKVLPSLNDGVRASQENEQARLAREIDQFFQAEEMRPFTEFYGYSWDDVTDEQTEHRNQMLELADHMIVGAAQHGRRLSPDEAMELAHHAVASEFNAETVRKDLATQVQKRRSGMTLKPSGKSPAPQSGPPDRDVVLRNARQRLAEAFK